MQTQAVRLEELGEDRRLMTLNLGPQHPSTHGVLRLLVQLDGETVRDCEAVIGYLHRCHEKIFESLTYPQCIPFMDRTDYLGPIMEEVLFAEAVEMMMGMEIPERARYLRVIFMELQRIVSHIIWFGTFAMDLGATTAFVLSFKDREKGYDLFDEATGARMLPNYIRLGGLRNDVSDEWLKKLEAYIDMIEKEAWPKYNALIMENFIFKKRTQNVAVISKEEAIAFAASGPVLRGSGVAYDLRKTYAKTVPGYIYDQFDFDIPVREGGDSYDRAVVRMQEILESVKIIRQALNKLPDGKVMAKIPRAFRPPKGEIFHRIESPRGEMSIHLVSDGSTNPYRAKLRSSGFVHLQLMPTMNRGMKLADLIVSIGSIDLDLGEVDR